MTKRKLQHFEETAGFPNFFQPGFEGIGEGFPMRGLWHTNFFKNDGEIHLELGCGKGEFTVGLARLYPHNNFIGIDIKGARMWRGAKTAIEQQMENVAFVRTQIYYLDRFFAGQEVNSIWITFPDPQPQLSRIHKRLTAHNFLETYRRVLKSDGVIHLKTDDDGLFEFTLGVIEEGKHHLEFKTFDIYQEAPGEIAAGIQTFYERIWLAEGKKIKYLRFRLNQNSTP